MTKLSAILAAFIAIGSVVTSPASASTNDFFQCPVEPEEIQSNPFSRVNVYLERCYSAARGRDMYRGNVKGNILAKDALRVGYRPWEYNGFVAHSYRSAPHDVVPGTHWKWEMPGEWYLANNYGFEIQACVDLLDDARNRKCT